MPPPPRLQNSGEKQACSGHVGAKPGPCLDSKPSFFQSCSLPNPRFVQALLSPLHSCLLRWNVWEITNNPVWLIEICCEKSPAISLKSELFQGHWGATGGFWAAQRQDHIFALAEFFSISQPYLSPFDKYKNLISRSPPQAPQRVWQFPSCRGAKPASYNTPVERGLASLRLSLQFSQFLLYVFSSEVIKCR